MSLKYESDVDILKFGFVKIYIDILWFFIIKIYLSKLFLETMPISEDFLYQHKGSLSILTGIAAMITYIWFVRVHQYHCTNVLEILAWSMFDFSLLGRCTLHAERCVGQESGDPMQKASKLELACSDLPAHRNWSVTGRVAVSWRSQTLASYSRVGEARFCREPTVNIIR